MEVIAAETQIIARSLQPRNLPEDRSEWPETARTSFFDVLHELDRWCRRHDWPTALNASHAEEAVRQTW